MVFNATFNNNVKPESKIWEMKMTDLFKGEICLKYEQQIYH
jgi:hypothetical protein